jgi:ATP-binding cassette, subfamily B, bacterial PglK
MIIINDINKILYLLSPKEKKQTCILMCAIVLMGIFEVVGVTSVLPFMKSLSETNLAEHNTYIKWFYNIFHFSNDNQLKTFLGVFVVVALFVSNAFAALTMWGLYHFTYRRNHTISQRLLDNYISRPYEYFLNSNSSDLSKNILSEVQQVVDGVFVPGMQMLAKLVVSIFLLSALFIVNPTVAFIVVLAVGFAYLIIYQLFRSRLVRIGNLRVRANRDRFRAIADLIGGIKDIKLLGRENSFLNLFTKSSVDYASCQVSNQVISMMPRHLIEFMIFGGVMAVVLYILTISGNISDVLPTVIFFAFACYRMMPAIQQVYVSVTKVSYNWPALDLLYNNYLEGVTMYSKSGYNSSAGDNLPVNAKLAFEKSIALNNLSFSYSESSRYHLNNVNMEIENNRTVALVGKTGCGKTTLVDLIMGILIPHKGHIAIDNVVIGEHNVRLWQRMLGYVPQKIYLSDNSFVKNIAFGVEDGCINRGKVVESAKMANIHEFISALPNGYNTMVGERGIRLSGGQIQRIAIARALYNDPAVLIMDEATSSLDGITEDVVMKAINDLSHRKTIIIIAHRLSTVRNADKIYLMENGSLVSEGTYRDLIKSSQAFRAMAKVDMSKGVAN